MKLKATISLLAIILVGSSLTALAQKKCSFNILGTWKVQVSTDEARLYRFNADGTVKVLSVVGSAEPREIASASYGLVDNAKAAKQISFRATGKNRIFGRLRATMDVVNFDDSSITCSIPGATGTTRWTRVDTDRHFIVLVARQGEFYDASGSAFPAVIKLAGGVSKIDAAGIYSEKGEAAFGAVPAASYKEYLRDSRGDSEVILRLEINSRQYERALKIVQEWQRRAREDALPYTIDSSLSAPLPLNNILLVKAVTETLNLCQNDVDLYKLDYEYPADWIANEYGPEFVPFFYFKELRRRNEARHIEYKKFQELVPLANVASR
jgi:hypothetical protein